MKYAGTESSVLEFKEEIPKNDQIIKTIIGFCNQHGGKLVVGVANDGSIVGMKEEEAVIAIETLGNAIYEASAPPILPLVYTQVIDDKILLIIEVSAGANKPYYRKAEGLDRGVYIRLGRSTLRASLDLIEELRWQSRGRSYDTLALYQTTESDLNENEIRKFVERKGIRGKIDSEFLYSYYLITQEHSKIYATVGGILLFGKQTQRFLPESFIICSHFKGVEGREALASIDCMGTLFEQFQAAFHFITTRLSRSFSIQKSRREEILEIPEEAIREILLNAIVHRNYHINSAIKIAIYDDRIEFFSPGTWPGPLNNRTLRSGISYIRNVSICKVFREAGYIEKLGSGLLTVFKSYEQRGLKPPSIFEGENFVKCILPRILAPEDETSGLQPVLDLFQLTETISVADVVERLKVSRTTAGRRLAALIELGKIEKVGKGRAAHYTLVHTRT